MKAHQLVVLAAAIGAPAGAVQAQAPSQAPMDEIIVLGRAAQLYRVDSTTVGKLPTAPLESSQSIAVIPDSLITDQGARDAQDLYRNLSGVSFYSFGGVSARGFRQEEVYYDGLRGDPNAGFAVPQLFNIERVEYLKGPAGMLYGPGAPGGLLNYVTRKPHQDFDAEFGVVAGTSNRLGALAKVNAPLGDSFAVRGGAFVEDRGMLRFNASQETMMLDGGLSYDTDRSSLIFQVARYDLTQNAARLRGVPVDDDGNFLTTRRYNTNEPTDFLKMKSDVFQVRFESQWTDSLWLDATARYNDATERQQYHEPNALFDSIGDGQIDSVRREFRDQIRTQESWSLGANAVWSTLIGDNIENRMLIGADYFTIDEDRFASRVRGNTTPTPGLPSPISFINPVYGLSDSSTYIDGPVVPNVIESTRQGFYLLDELTLGRFILVGGLRFDRFDDNVNGVQFKDNKVTYRLGGVYRVRDDVSLYAQYATSFEPQSPGDQIPQVGGPFDPSAGSMIEAGVKTALMNGRIQTSLALYQIVRDNVLQDDPLGDIEGDGFDNKIPAGEVTSRGLELDIATDITPDWVAVMNYAFNRARITEGFADGARDLDDNIGDRFANTPSHTLGFWTRYQWPESGFAVALGGDYVSRRLSVDAQTVKPYMIFDASLIYERDAWRAMLRVDNLLDERYATSGFRVRTGHYVGRPRTAFLELRYRFD